jgi:hypothetical protein
VPAGIEYDEPCHQVSSRSARRARTHAGEVVFRQCHRYEPDVEEGGELLKHAVGPVHQIDLDQLVNAIGREGRDPQR